MALQLQPYKRTPGVFSDPGYTSRRRHDTQVQPQRFSGSWRRRRNRLTTTGPQSDLYEDLTTPKSEAIFRDAIRCEYEDDNDSGRMCDARFAKIPLHYLHGWHFDRLAILPREGYDETYMDFPLRMPQLTCCYKLRRNKEKCSIHRERSRVVSCWLNEPAPYWRHHIL